MMSGRPTTALPVSIIAVCKRPPRTRRAPRSDHPGAPTLTTQVSGRTVQPLTALCPPVLAHARHAWPTAGPRPPARPTSTDDQPVPAGPGWRRPRPRGRAGRPPADRSPKPAVRPDVRGPPAIGHADRAAAVVSGRSCPLRILRRTTTSTTATASTGGRDHVHSRRSPRTPLSARPSAPVSARTSATVRSGHAEPQTITRSEVLSELAVP